MTRWPLAPGTPTGQVRSRGFRTVQTSSGGRRRCEPFDEWMPTFTPSAEAQALRLRRAERELTLREAARRLGLTVVQLFDLETGELVPRDVADWPRLLAALAEGP